MKFVFVNLMAGLYRGGGENFDLNLSRELDRLGHEIEFVHLRPLTHAATLSFPAFVTPRPVRSPWTYLWSQRLHGVPIVGTIRGLRGLPGLTGQVVFEVLAFLHLFRRRHERVVVWICGLSLLGFLVSKLLRVPCYVRYPGPPMYPLARFCARRVRTAVANGDAFLQLQRIGVPSGKLLRLEVGLNPAALSTTDRITARSKLGLPADAFVLLTAGRLVKIKNFHLVLRAFAIVHRECPGALLVVAGDGPLRDQLMRYATQLGVAAHVRFVGGCAPRELADYYAAADVFVLGSDYDNFPNVVVEAMANGLPVVATAVGGIPTQIRHGRTGLLAPRRDAGALAGGVLHLALNPRMRERMGVDAREATLETHNWTRTADGLLRHLKESNEPGTGQVARERNVRVG